VKAFLLKQVDLFEVIGLLVSIAYNPVIPVQWRQRINSIDEIEVISGGGFEMNSTLNGLFQDKGKVRTLRAVTIVIIALIIYSIHAGSKPVSRPIDVLGNLREVSKLQRSTVLSDEFHEGNSVEFKLIFRIDLKFLLGKFERLVDEVAVLDLQLYIEILRKYSWRNE